MSAQETKQVPVQLKPCPCGKVPEELHLYGETHQAKWAMVMGSCCNEWLVEFKNHYATDPDVIMLNAIEAWNLAERAAAPSPVSLPVITQEILDEFGGFHKLITPNPSTGPNWTWTQDAVDFACLIAAAPSPVEPEAHAQSIIQQHGEHYAALLLKALEDAL